MKFVAVLFLFKLVTLAGSIATTLWAISFFAFPGLEPYRWQLLGWGFAAVAIGEGGAYLVARYLQRGGT